jgi:hypothetical protein
VVAAVGRFDPDMNRRDHIASTQGVEAIAEA